MSSKKPRTFITFEIDPKTREAFSDRITSEGKTVTGVLKQFINDYLQSEGNPTNPEMIEIANRLAMVEDDLAAVKEKLGSENARLVGEMSA